MLDALLKYVPNALHPAYLSLLNHLPDYLPRVAVAGESCAAAGYLLKKRPGFSVTGAVREPRQAAVARQLLDRVVIRREELSDLPDDAFDAILLCNLEASLDEALEWLPPLARHLSGHGQVYAIFGAPGFARPGAENAEAFGARVVDALQTRGFGLYGEWPLNDAADDLAGMLVMAVPPTYNPIAHARSLQAVGRPESSYHVLDLIPRVYLEDPHHRVVIGLEKLTTLARWMHLARGHDTSNLLARAQEHFYVASDEAPRHVEAYQRMADCWEAAGDAGMARRLLRSIHFAVPEAPVAPDFERLDALYAAPPAEPPPPRWDTARPMRVLLVMHPRPHYGLDALFDGLCACLGDDRVTDYPWKATLHGGEIPENRHYPCRFNRTGAPKSLEAILPELRSGAYDCILFGDVEGDVPPHEVQAILGARGDCPVFLMDALDEMTNLRPRVLQRLGLEAFDAYFKREMLPCIDYGPNSWPMPFSYDAAQALDTPVATRSCDFFWAGHRRFGQRRLYLETLEQRFGWDLDAKFSQAEYQARIRESRVGLNCFGMGFDTVRYWELPAQGCMLISDRLPIRIPHNFVDGVHAVYFDDLGELVEKLDYYLAHPKESLAIAEAGRQHFLEFHTNRARAAQVLGRLQQVLSMKKS